MSESVEIPTEDSGNKSVEDQAQEQKQAQEQQAEASRKAGEGHDEQRPEWLPEKFQSPEDMAKAYQELERKLGEKAQSEDSSATNQADEKGEGSEEDQSDEQVAKFDLSKYDQEFQETGDLSDDSRAELKKMGFTKDRVDTYLAGLKASDSQYEEQVVEVVGGREQYDQMAQWAKNNLSAAEQEAYDEAVSSGSVEQAKLAVEALKNRWQASEGVDPSLIRGKPSNERSDVFKSSAQIREAMRDPRYKNDQAYRQAVDAKIGRSPIFQLS